MSRQMPILEWPIIAGLVLGAMMIAMPANADALKDEIAPTGKLRVAIAISPAGGAFWCTRTESGGYAGVPVDLGKAMAAQLGVPVEFVAHQNSGQIVDATSKGTWDITLLPKDPEREAKMSFGPIYEVSDATYIVKPGSTVTDFATLDQPEIRLAVEAERTVLSATGGTCRAPVGALGSVDGDRFSLIVGGVNSDGSDRRVEIVRGARSDAQAIAADAGRRLAVAVMLR